MTSIKVLVTVGSDHHPFDRLIGWVDDWADTCEGKLDLVVQHGTASPPRHGQSTDFLPHDLLLQRVARSDIVVAQGGPMGIVEARRLGVVPIVVPRRHSLGEVVDDHQVEFCRQLAAAGEIELAETAVDLTAALNHAALDPRRMHFTPESLDEQVRAAAERFGSLVAELPSRRMLLPLLR